MSKILVIADHADGALKKSTLQTITFARQLAKLTGGSYDLAVIGHGVGVVAEGLATFGAGSIHVVDDPAFEHYLAQPFGAAITQLVDQAGASHVVASAGTLGKDVMPRVAGAKGWGMVADCVGLAGDGGDLRYKRPMYAGNIIASVRVNTDGAVITVRGSEFAAAEPAAGATAAVAATVDPGSCGARFVGFEGTKSERPELTEADVVVAGGRGLKDGPNFDKVMEPLADAFGAAIGASRAAVDSGFCPNDCQVGQTGKVVAPKLYFAVAISGAIQHLAGMKNSKCIVAINTNPEAPIFQIADYGLVQDAFGAVPELIERYKALS